MTFKPKKSIIVGRKREEEWNKQKGRTIKEPKK